MGHTNVKVLKTGNKRGQSLRCAENSSTVKIEANFEALLSDLKSIPNVAKLLETSQQSIRNAITDGRIPTDAVVWIDNTYRLIRWSLVKDLKIREYNTDRKSIFS